MNSSQLSLSTQRNRHQAAESSDSRRPIGFAAFVLLVAAIFGPQLVSLARYALGTHIHSHVVLVPFVSAYLIFVQRGRFTKLYTTSMGWAIIPMVAGLAAILAIWKSGPDLRAGESHSLAGFAFVSFVIAGGFLFLGRKWMTDAAFPFAFLLFMIPLPHGAVEWLETASKLASAEMAALLFSVAGTPVLRDGNVFQLPGIVIEVAQECSGIRSSWVLFITSLLASYLFLKTPWRRAVLVSLVIPLAILRNGLRILTIGVLCVQFGPQMINSVIHHCGGPLFFALSLIPLFLVIWWLRKGEARGQRLASPTSDLRPLI